MAWHHCRQESGLADAAGLVFSTKLAPPRAGSVVERARLFRLLDEGARGRFTMVIGPPGSGKSALLASWVRAGATLSGPLAWLTLDEEDNEPTRLRAHLVATLRRAGTAGPVAGGDVLAGEPWVERSVPALLEAFGALSAPTVLVLDDVHELRPGPARNAVLQLARHAPACLRVILASRQEPDLPLHKMRAAGELTEVRGADLAFTEAETDELFRRAGVDLTPGQVAQVLRVSGGWAMGLQLAAITRSEDEDCRTCLERWSKVVRLCSDFLLGELLEPMRAEDQELLLRTSVLSRLNASLVRAITGRIDASRMLRRLSAEQDLLTRVDEWTYRQNPMIRQALARELIERYGPAEVVSLRRVACEWYTAHGMPEQARQYATAAGVPGPFPDASDPVPHPPVGLPEASRGEVRDGEGDQGASPVAGPLPHRGTTRPVPSRSGAYGQRLTASELEVLRLLTTDLTLDEIAARRHVSLNTVKTQVKGVYRKLSVGRRRAAVEAARLQGLL